MERRSGYLAIAIAVAIILALALFGGLQQTREVAADAITNYYTLTAVDGSTGYTTTGGNSSGWDSSGYGSAVIHIIADGSATTATLTVYPQFSNELGYCTSVSSWFTGTDYFAYSVGASSQNQVVLTPATIASTYAITPTTAQGGGSYPITTTYTYGSASVTTYTVSSTSAGAGYNSVVQSLATTGDEVVGREFSIYGRCMRLKMTVSGGTTAIVTPTIYVMQHDRQE